MLKVSKHLLSNIKTVGLIFNRHVQRKTFTKGNSKKSYGKLTIIGTTLGVVSSTVFGLVLYSNDEETPKKKIVILGSGWGAVSLLRSLKPGKFDISIVSPENYFLFTPLLPGVTVGTVEGRSIAEPIRKIIGKKHKGDVKFFEAQCTNVDVNKNKVVCTDESSIVGEKNQFTLDYDYLVVAVGAQTATYNIKGVQENTHFLKNIQQAQEIRKNIMDSFETAAIPGQQDDEIKRLLHFVVVGGGPTGVEFAAELRDFVKHDLKKFYPAELINNSKVTLVDGLNKILNTYSEEISRYTEEHFKKDGITTIMGTFVTGVEDNVIHLRDAKTRVESSFPYGMCVWCAGIAPRGITKQMMKDIPGQTNRMGLITDHFFNVKNTENIFAIGDCATIQFEKLGECIDNLLDHFGIAKDGEMDHKQYNAVMEKAMKKYPHLCHVFKEIKEPFDQVCDGKHQVISVEQFRKVAQLADADQTALPPTAQVAAQEGKYLGKLFSKHESEIEKKQMISVDPFKYNHMGSFAYIGNNRAVLQLPIVGAFKGLSTMWLWRGAYASECVSLRMRTLVLFDWIKSCFWKRCFSHLNCKKK